MTTAPIILFVYNRPEHTRRTVEALKKNEFASASDLFVYSDASKNEHDELKVEEVRGYIHSIDGFKKVTVVEREKNLGLATSIIDGVTHIVNQYGKIIVLEDDIVTSPYFLTFMNNALARYSDEPRVWHISGWNYPIDPKGLEDTFFWRMMDCWGWATWSDRWQHFRKNPSQLMETWSKDKIKRFNLDNSQNFWGQVTANYSGKMNTWAIFWYATCFEHHGLCLNPARTLVRNIGHDGSGENCGTIDSFTVRQLAEKIDAFPDHLAESALAVRRVKAFYKEMRVSFFRRMIRRLKKVAIFFVDSLGWYK